MKFNADKTLAAAMIAVTVLLGYFVASEVLYLRQTDPERISHVFDFYSQFGPPLRVNEVVVQGQEYFVLTGPLPPWWSLAIISSPPQYVFDEQGAFVDWTPDPGDAPAWSVKWNTDTGNSISDADLRNRFDIASDAKAP